jgi:hypothetical protein
MTDHTPHTGDNPQPPSYPLQQPRVPEDEAPPEQRAFGGHGLMMLVCLIPLFFIGILVATGAVGSGLFVYALVCMVMMGAMMFAMSRGTRH